MMQILYCELIVKTFGSDHPREEYMAICWKIILTLVKVIFREFSKAQVVAEQAYRFPDRVNTLYFWGVLQAH